jgi:hypothetical protein
VNNSSARPIVWLVVALAPVFLALFFIYRYGVNVPHWDQWELVALLEKVYAGKLSLADLFSQHNEHRLIFPRLFMILLAAVSHYNTLFEMYFGWLLLLLCAYLIFNSYRQKFGISEPTLLRFVPVIWLLFSWRQYENLLWGWQITFFMTALAIVLTHYLLESSKSFDKYFFWAIGSGIVASFSNSNGLLVWPIGLLQIWTSHLKVQADSEPVSRLNASVWLLTAACIYILYFIDYTKPLNHPSLLHFATAPVSSLRYLLGALGSPLGVKRGTAMAGGLLLAVMGILAYVIEFKKSSKFIFSFWDALILFALLSSLMLAVGRSGFGIGQALSSRYTTFTILGIVGLYIKSLEIFSARGKLNTALRVIFLCLIVQGLGVSFFHGVKKAKAIRASRQASVYLLSDLASQDDKQLAKFLYPDPRRVRQLAPFLASHKLSVFNRVEALR